jgi:hypothetical protein
MEFFTKGAKDAKDAKGIIRILRVLRGSSSLGSPLRPQGDVGHQPVDARALRVGHLHPVRVYGHVAGDDRDDFVLQDLQKAGGDVGPVVGQHQTQTFAGDFAAGWFLAMKHTVQ